MNEKLTKLGIEFAECYEKLLLANEKELASGESEAATIASRELYDVEKKMNHLVIDAHGLKHVKRMGDLHRSVD